MNAMCVCPVDLVALVGSGGSRMVVIPAYFVLNVDDDNGGGA